MSNSFKRSFVIVFTVLLLTGLLYAVPYYYNEITAGEWPIWPNRSFLMQIHGAVAMLALIQFGILLNHHVLPYISRPKKRRSGVSLVVFMATLTITGYLLYYSGSLGVQNVSRILHTLVGVLFFGIFAWHYAKK